MEKLLRVKEVAEILGVSEDRVYSMARERILPCVNLGRQLRFSPRALDEFIQNGGKCLPGGWRREA